MNSALPRSSTHIGQVELSDSARVIDYLVVPREDQEILKELMALKEVGVRSYVVDAKVAWEEGLAQELGLLGGVQATRSGLELPEGTLLIGCTRDKYLTVRQDRFHDLDAGRLNWTFALGWFDLDGQDSSSS